MSCPSESVVATFFSAEVLPECKIKSVANINKAVKTTVLGEFRLILFISDNYERLHKAKLVLNFLKSLLGAIPLEMNLS